MKVWLAMRIIVGATILGIAAGGSLVARAQSSDSEKIGELFKQIKLHVVEAEHDAELLESYTRSKVGWKTHSTAIEQMKSHVNDLGRDFVDAKTLRAEGSEWQKEAIDEIEPLLQGMAAHLSATIKHLNENQGKTRMQPWVDYVKGNREYANRAGNLIRDYVAYGEAKANSEALEKKLAIAPNPGQE